MWTFFNALQSFDKKTSGGAATLANKSAVENENISNNQLHKPIIQKEKKSKKNHCLWTMFGALINLICS